MSRKKNPFRAPRKRKDLPTRTQLCLDCGKKKMKMIYNPESKRFEGFRVCKDCRKLQKRKYLGAA